MDSNHRGERSPRLGYSQMPQPLGYLLTIKMLAEGQGFEPWHPSGCTD